MQVRLSWQGPSGAAAGGSCDGNSAVQWPALQGLVILGAPAANPASVTMQVRAALFPSFAGVRWNDPQLDFYYFRYGGEHNRYCSSTLKNGMFWCKQVARNGTASNQQSVEPSLVAYNATSHSLAISGLNSTLLCGEDLTFSWST